MRKGQFRFCANYVTIRFGKTYEPTKGMFNMNKITIIGTGSVGATIAYTLNTMGIASEIVLIDINTEKALGEALDIRQGNSFSAAIAPFMRAITAMRQVPISLF